MVYDETSRLSAIAIALGPIGESVAGALFPCRFITAVPVRVHKGAARGFRFARGFGMVGALLIVIRSCDICEDILESRAGDDLRPGKICVLLHEVLNQSLHIGDVIVRSKFDWQPAERLNGEG